MSFEKIYLSGPMTGLPDLNYPAFNRATKILRSLGYEVYNPAEWEETNNKGVFNHLLAFEDYCSYIVRSAHMLVVLPAWEDSVGATGEVFLAHAVQKPVYPIEMFEEYALSLATNQMWEIHSDGASWHITSRNGDIIADDMPMAEYAEHIVKLHNEALMMKFAP